MQTKETALRQIDDIYAILNNNIKTVLSGPLMIAIGLGVMVIPALELVLNSAIDHYFTIFGSFSNTALFLTRAAFYWSLFWAISRYFRPHNVPHAIIQKVFAVGKLLPFIALSVAASLAISGFSDIIAPFILILIGCFFLFYGQFTARIVQMTALSLILAGIIGILLTQYHVLNLWMFLVEYQGLAFVIMGLLLHRSDKAVEMGHGE